MTQRPDTTSRDEHLILPRLLRYRSQHTPERMFLREVEGAQLTYGQVFELATRWATGLHRAGVRPEDRVLTMIPTSVDAALAWFGCAMLGAINVPVNTAYVGKLLAHAVNVTTPTVAIVEGELLERFADLALDAAPTFVVRGSASGRDLAGTDDWAKLVVDESVLTGVDGSTWGDLSTLLFTSGTTGPSKAVMLPWRQLYESGMTVWQGGESSADDVFYLPWPLNHISGVGPLYAMCVAGGSLVLREKWSTGSFMDDVFTFGCTHTTLMASMVRYVDELAVPMDRGPFPLKRVFLAPITERSVALTRRLGVEYSTVFNQTEISAPIASVGYEPVPLGSCGRVRSGGVSVRVVDQQGDDVPVGARGELLVRTEDPTAMSAGYWGMPEATRKAWTDGWFHTGDLLSQDEDGWFYYLGRLKEVIRVRGENVSATELEETVEEHPEVVEAAAVGVPNADLEEDIVLCVRLRSHGTTESDDVIEQIRTYCAEQLPKFMLPAHVLAVTDFPRTPTGKIRKDELLRCVGSHAGIGQTG
jgi:carnitine-CoA ligase